MFLHLARTALITLSTSLCHVVTEEKRHFRSLLEKIPVRVYEVYKLFRSVIRSARIYALRNYLIQNTKFDLPS